MIKRVSHFFHFSVRFNLNTKITNLLVSLLILWLEGIYRVVASTWHCLGHSFITHKPFLYLSQSCQGRRILSNKGSATRGVGGNSGGDCEIDREWHSRGEWDSRGHRGWDSRRDSRENSEDDSRNGEKVEGCYTAFYPKLASVHRFFFNRVSQYSKNTYWPRSRLLQARQPVRNFYPKCYIVRHCHQVSRHKCNNCHRRENYNRPTGKKV